MKFMNNSKDKGGFSLYAPQVSDTIYTARLAADTDTTLVVPAKATVAIFSAEVSFWVSKSTITLPSSTSFTETDAELNPEARTVVPGETLHIRAVNQNRVSVSFFAGE